MTTKIFDVWLVYTDGDDRSYGDPTHFFSDGDKAVQFSKGTGWYGGDARVNKGKAIKVGSKVYLIDQEIDLDGVNKKKKEELRAAAIKKLTPEELEALKGIEDTDD